ncbi:hypothetical protein [Vampirovibrio sp.]|uniref:hypothetical protein n=1 Tax=Vampirovibrio sp. TaxID=2717857 RepID=UPI0035941594
MSYKKLPVSINVFPSLDYVELVQFDEKSGEIEKASALPCQFDTASRQMSDRDLMLQTIRDLYNMNRIPFSTPSVLVLPSFFTREIDLPTEFSKEELRFALVSEAERFYFFKKAEPQIGWINLSEDRLLYSAFPKTEIEKYMKVFQELQIPLLGIELSYLSILRGLIATGAVSHEIDNAEPWALLVISDYSFFVSIQRGLKIIKTADAPLSVTEEEDEQATLLDIVQDFEAFTDRETFAKLIVVNNANRINSDDLLRQLGFPGSLTQIDQNALTLKSRGASEAPFPCSLEGLGGVFYKQYADVPGINFQLETADDLVSLLNYRQQAFKWLLVSNGVVFVLSLLIWGAMSLMLWQKDQEREAINHELTALGEGVDTLKMDGVNRKKFIKKAVDLNVQANNFLVKLGASIEPNVWLEEIQIDLTDMEKPPVIALDGKAMSLSSINGLLTPLNAIVEGANLQVSSAAPATSDDGQAYFTWSIQNQEAVPAAGTPPASGG